MGRSHKGPSCSCHDPVPPIPPSLPFLLLTAGTAASAASVLTGLIPLFLGCAHACVQACVRECTLGLSCFPASLCQCTSHLICTIPLIFHHKPEAAPSFHGLQLLKSSLLRNTDGNTDHPMLRYRATLTIQMNENSEVQALMSRMGNPSSGGAGPPLGKLR